MSVSVVDFGERLSSLRLPSEERRREMERSLARHGQLTPLLCCRIGAGLEVADGFKRLYAARALAWSALRAQVVETDLTQAKLLVWRSNSGPVLTDLEEAWVVRSLYREDGLTQPQIARLIGRHKSWVCRRLMLAEGLAVGVEADVRLGLLSASAAREIARLPRGNQDDVARVTVKRGLTTRQTAKLVDGLLLTESEKDRQALLAVESEGKVEKKRLSHGEWLMVDVAQVRRSSARLHARLLERPLSSLGEGAAEVARRNLQELPGPLASLCRTITQITEERTHARIP